MRTRRVFPILVLCIVAGVPGSARAAGFALLEQSGSSIGHAVAGSGASAEDASTVFFNPAGLGKLDGVQAVAAAHVVSVSSRFSGNGSNTGGFSRGGQGGDPGAVAVVPNFYASLAIGEKFVAGLGINTPFGLSTKYDDDWVGRFQGISSELRTINVNPSVAYKVSDKLSLGFGLNWQRADVNLTSAVATRLGEGRTKLEAHDDAYGWNAGALFDLAPDMRLGLSYRSQMHYNLSGTATTTFLSSGATAARYDATAAATFPDMAVLSIVQNYGEKWDLLGDLAYTHWSVLRTVNVVQKSNGVIVDTLNFNFKNTWRVALGLNYRHDEQWTIKSGFAYDQSPVDGDNRTVRLPDARRLWLSMGARYRFSRSGALDLAYAHLFSADAPINASKTQIGSPFSSTVTGEYQSHVDILSAQVAFTF